MYRQYGKKQIRLPYDVDSPFGTYRPTKSKETLFRLFQNRALPRNFVYKAFLKSANKQQKDGIFDVTVGGISMRMKPELNATEAKFLRRGLQYDKYEWKALAKACSSVEKPIFIDVGANVGLYSFLLAKSVPEVRVLAYEPHPGLCKQMKYNLSVNTGHNISVTEFAVSDQLGKAWLKTSTDGDLGQTRLETEGDVEVKCTTLQAVVEQEKLSHIDALKVDVEGYEDRVLVPYMRNASDSMLPNTIVVEVVTSDHWLEDPIETAISRGYKEVKRNKMNSILVLQN